VRRDGILIIISMTVSSITTVYDSTVKCLCVRACVQSML